MLVSMTVALVLLGGGYFMLNVASDVYKRISGHEDGALQMKRAARRMQVDLLASNALDTNVTPVGGPVGLSGDAVWMLSSKEGDAASGPTTVTESGTPYWQRNVLYYPSRPQGDTCPGGVNGDGYEDMCPHKVITRKVIDTMGTTTTGFPSAKEPFLTDVSTFLTRPSGLSPISEPEVTDAEIVGVNILTMRVEKDPDPTAPGEILVTLQAFNEEAGRKTTNIGTTNLGNHAKTQTHLISVFPRNTQ